MGKFEDLTGKKFGKLTVVHRVQNSASNKIQYLCQCECGNEKVIIGASLKNGTTKSCGHCKYEDLTGQIFGRLTVEKLAHHNNGKAVWHCICSCGKEKDIPASNLKAGTRSCGCLIAEVASQRDNAEDLIGRRFGRGIVIRRAENYVSPMGQKAARWVLKCDCGNEYIAQAGNLKNGNTCSCGCLANEQRSINGQKNKR